VTIDERSTTSVEFARVYSLRTVLALRRERVPGFRVPAGVQRRAVADMEHDLTQSLRPFLLWHARQRELDYFSVLGGSNTAPAGYRGVVSVDSSVQGEFCAVELVKLLEGFLIQPALSEHVAFFGAGDENRRGLDAGWTVVHLDRRDRARGETMTVLDLAMALGRTAFRKVTWRHGSKAKLSSQFCFVRVKTMHDDGLSVADREPVWLVAEWLAGEDKPTKFILTTLPRRMSRKQIVRIFKERWRTERMYEDLKGELGLDHFEGRLFTGWHHHVSVVLCCYAFVVSERVSVFPPSAGRRRRDSQISIAA
jgi:hypothetical protein